MSEQIEFSWEAFPSITAKVTERLREELGREPSADELAKALEDEAQKFLDYTNAGSLFIAPDSD